jgi:putative glutamine amidotransferase
MSDHPGPTPVIAVSACRKGEGIGAYQRVGAKYIDALRDTVDALPIIMPAIGTGAHVDITIDMIDGLMLTGSPSNIEPHHYEGGAVIEGDENDPARDSTTLSLLPRAIEAGVPVFGLCRGIQEINVALGGSLHQKVHECDGRFDHRSDKTLDHESRYAPTHKVVLEPDGLLHRLMGCEEIAVNSLHGQAIDRLAEPLRIEARAPDGTIEAVSLRQPDRFCLGVQWHPEWRPRQYWPYQKLFEAFGEACRMRAQQRRSHESDRRVA